MPFNPGHVVVLLIVIVLAVPALIQVWWRSAPRPGEVRLDPCHRLPGRVRASAVVLLVAADEAHAAPLGQRLTPDGPHDRTAGKPRAGRRRLHGVNDRPQHAAAMGRARPADRRRPPCQEAVRRTIPFCSSADTSSATVHGTLAAHREYRASTRRVAGADTCV